MLSNLFAGRRVAPGTTPIEFTGRQQPALNFAVVRG